MNDEDRKILEIFRVISKENNTEEDQNLENSATTTFNNNFSIEEAGIRDTFLSQYENYYQYYQLNNIVKPEKKVKKKYKKKPKTLVFKIEKIPSMLNSHVDNFKDGLKEIIISNDKVLENLIKSHEINQNINYFSQWLIDNRQISQDYDYYHTEVNSFISNMNNILQQTNSLRLLTSDLKLD